jgi:hypothetical protein
MAETLTKESLQEKFAQIGQDIGQLVGEKQAAYGDAVSRTEKILRVLFPSGIPESQFSDALLLIRVVDKLCRISTDKDALGESPWRDIAGYALLALDYQRKALSDDLDSSSEQERIKELEEALKVKTSQLTEFLTALGPYSTIKDADTEERKIGVIIDTDLLKNLGVEVTD